MVGGRLCIILVAALLGQALSVPAGVLRFRRGYVDNELGSREAAPAGAAYSDLVAAESGIRKTRQDAPSASENPIVPSSSDDEDDDDDFNEPMNTAPSTSSGSSIFSLLNLANALFPGSSASSVLIRRIIREYLLAYQARQFMRRHDVKDNEIEMDNVLKPRPFQKLEIVDDVSVDSESDSSQETDEDSDSENDDDGDENDDNNGGEESIENKNKGNNENGDSKSKQAESAGDDNDSDYEDEPPGGGDGQGGGVLGLLAGLSGGENGESDLGSLLAAISGIVVNLSGDGVDINAIIASGLGLFVGLLSEGEQNPGEIIGSYLLTSLDTITGGGSKNNGKFFGKIISKLITGTSAGGNPEGESDENGEGMQMKDSGGFFASFLMGLLGDMSKGSSGGSKSHPWVKVIPITRPAHSGL